jgi:hypothetical protein
MWFYMPSKEELRARLALVRQHRVSIQNRYERKTAKEDGCVDPGATCGLAVNHQTPERVHALDSAKSFLKIDFSHSLCRVRNVSRSEDGPVTGMVAGNNLDT